MIFLLVNYGGLYKILSDRRAPCFRSWGLLLLFWASFEAHAWQPSEVGLDMRVTSINYSEPVTILGNWHRWRTDFFTPGNRVYAKQTARTGLSYRDWAFGYSRNLYYFLNFSEGASQLLYAERNGQLRAQQEVLDVYFRANNASGQGAYLRYSRQWGNVELAATVTYLTLSDLTYGEGEGVFDPGKPLANNTHLVIDYAFRKDRIFREPVAPPKGRGLTLDLQLGWYWQGHRLDLAMEEVYSRLKWNTAPGNRIEGNFRDLQLRDDAVVKYSHFRAQFDQTLPVHTLLSYRYRLPWSISLGVEYERLDRKDWRKLVADWHLLGEWTASLRWTPEDNLWGVGLQHPYLVFSLEADTLNYRRSHYLRGVAVLRATFD